LSKERGRCSGGESGDQSVDGKSQAAAHSRKLKFPRRLFKFGLLDGLLEGLIDSG
jgi:hypothetical protein